MDKYDVIVVGAGAAGLMAANTLSAAGQRVLVLEAQNRLGGRIWSSHYFAFSKPVELGAEFIHGNLPLTLQLLKKYNIAYVATGGQYLQWHQGQWITQKDEIARSRLLEKYLRKLNSDITVADFLQTLPDGEKYDEVKYAVRKFIEGYDAADINCASALYFKTEWLEEEDAQYRLPAGYSELVMALANECRAQGTHIITGQAATEITWRKNQVHVKTADRYQYGAAKAIITVPLGIMQLNDSDKGSVVFNPPLIAKKQAAQSLGFGAVIKIVLEFKTAFWKSAAVRRGSGKNLSKAGFIFTDTEVPTWWTHYPDKRALITGWIGGPLARQLKHLSNAEIINEGLNVLALITGVGKLYLQQELAAAAVGNWGAEPFTLGAYSYNTTGSAKAREQLCLPERETLYFAGEAYNAANEIATVEAALQSGLRAAKNILNTVVLS